MPPQAFWQGVEEFNQQAFYACHDTLEALWMEASQPEKNFYQGILQIAVGCHHLSNHNWRGAVILLGEGIGRLEDYQPVHKGIDITRLLEESLQLLNALQQVGEDGMGDFAEQLEIAATSGFPKIARVDAS
ncbi:MAG: DUF309 domain-containing protein [Cyanobacteria bacterium QH_8_48_120]|nr:MAG: DUF309 domain-containing protein [Cyanobacteria bacterium QH_8_48_120]